MTGTVSHRLMLMVLRLSVINYVTFGCYEGKDYIIGIYIYIYIYIYMERALVYADYDYLICTIH